MGKYKALLVEEAPDGNFSRAIVERDLDQLPAGDVLVRVRYSSVNYKDALSANGNKGVTRNYPHVPGIDAAGEVAASEDSRFSPGDEVIICGYDLGMNTAGGFGQYIRVPAGWVMSRPAGLSLRDSMVLGTAGFTAAICVEKLLRNGLSPDDGEVVVTGATGGVGMVAVALLAKLGFRVVASTGKSAQASLLESIGAARVVDRKDLQEVSGRPLLKELWAGAVDVVGGATLANLLKTVRYGGSVACCGLVGSPQLETSVFPFIIRGVNLLGVDSVNLPLADKQRLWERLAGEWKSEHLASLGHEIGMNQLPECLQTVLNGNVVGRYVLNLDA